jgi:hypothetical protein
MKRLFTFGCSFTQYWRWPTWADALGREYSHYENWGMCGAGNSLIFYSLVEAYQRNKIGPDDDVYIMWSNTSREDRYVKDRWLAAGNIYWTDGNALPLEYILNFTCERGYLIRDLATITATRHLLDQWGCKWKFMSMVPFAQTNDASELAKNPKDELTDDPDVRELYKDTLALIQPSVYETIFNKNWNSRPGIPNSYDLKQRDFHPTPLEHLEYLDKTFPGIITDSSTRTYMQNWEDRARQNVFWDQPNRPNVRF